MFWDGCKSVDDEPYSGHPSSMRTIDLVRRMRAVVNTDQQLGVWKIASKVKGDRETVRRIHTMPRGRTQDPAAVPRGKSCSAYALNSIASTLKKNFLLTYFRLQKLWNETSEFCLIFLSQTGWCHFDTHYSSYAAQQSFDETNILPIEFSCCMAFCGMQKPCLSRTALTSTLFSLFVAQQGCILLHSVTWHSGDAPVRRILYQGLQNCQRNWFPKI